MSSGTALLLGYGALAHSLTPKLKDSGLQVVGVSRSKPEAPVGNTGLDQHIQANLTLPSDLKKLPRKVDTVVITITPDSRGIQAYEQSYAQVADTLCAHFDTKAKIILVSSTSVYGQHSKDVLTEEDAPQPSSATGQILLDVEQRYSRRFGEQLCVVRPSGIYGLHRTYLVDRVKQGKPAGMGMTNRIMQSDLVNLLHTLCMTEAPKPLYLATDLEPAPSFEVQAYIAKKLGLAAPPKDTSGLSLGKRLASVHSDLSWLNYKNYQMGYDWILNQLNLLPANQSSNQA